MMSKVGKSGEIVFIEEQKISNMKGRRVISRFFLWLGTVLYVSLRANSLI